MRWSVESRPASGSAWMMWAISWVDRASTSMGSTPVLVAGLILTTATQCRLAFAPVGLGEATLAAWIVARVLLLLRTETSTFFEAPAVTWFWLVTCPLLAIGYLNASRRGVVATAAVHDTFAYLFVILFVVVLTRGPQAKERVRAAASAFSVALPCALGLVLVGAWISPALERLCFSDDPVPRFRALATNPNQVVFALVTTPFLILKSLNERDLRGRRMLHVIAFIVALGVGLTVRSDSLLISWALVGAALSVSVILRARRTGRWNRDADPWNAGAALVSVVALIGLTLSLPGARTVKAGIEKPGSRVHPERPGATTGAAAPEGLPQVVEDRFIGKYGQPDAGGRVLYWRTGLAAIRDSPIIGYGPGAHTGTTAPHQNMEAHNVALDWYLATGLLGELSLLGLAGYLFLRAFRPLQETKASIWLVLAVVGMLHFYMRQPVTWFLLAFIAL